MNTTVRAFERWTSRDEAQLAELAERKKRIFAKNTIPVRVIAEDIVKRTSISSHDNAIAIVLEFMINNADRIRDALEPFDSGERMPLPRLEEPFDPSN